MECGKLLYRMKFCSKTERCYLQELCNIRNSVLIESMVSE